MSQDGDYRARDLRSGDQPQAGERGRRCVTRNLVSVPGARTLTVMAGTAARAMYPTGCPVVTLAQ